MKAVVFEKIGVVKVVELPRPTIQEEKDAIVRITCSAICGSDLHILNGNVEIAPFDPIGHEAVGIVEEVGKGVRKIKLGDRVVVPVSIQCGECESCRNGFPVFCSRSGMFGHGKRWGGYGGCQAEYVRVPWADANLVRIPEGVTDEEAIFVSDNLSTGYMAAENGDIRPGDSVAVFGAGPVGLCALLSSKLFGAAWTLSIDLVDFRLDIARKVGADYVLNAHKADTVENIMKITESKGVDVAIEAVGSPKALNQCIEAVKNGGHISVIGVFPMEPTELPMRKILLKGLQIRAWRANLVHMDRLLKLLEYKKIDVTPLISHRLPLTEAVKGYELYQARKEGVMKVLLIP